MSTNYSDAFVFFGATGDLAHKKIFPSLQNMIKHGSLNTPIIGVAKSGWTVEQLREQLPGADLEPQLRSQRADHHGRGFRRGRPRQVL